MEMLLEYLILFFLASLCFFACASLLPLARNRSFSYSRIVPSSFKACSSYASCSYARWMILNDPLSRSLSRQNKNSQSESKNLCVFLLRFSRPSSSRSLHFSSYFLLFCWLFYGWWQQRSLSRSRITNVSAPMVINAEINLCFAFTSPKLFSLPPAVNEQTSG